uniref:Prothymosin alpha n=1 Tax=Pipistrellus kuhlii TaxID=59472 RepID=A0A7J7XWA0_PIPKU|nr:prothymosin alpha [Pipistrellus kuhlii]
MCSSQPLQWEGSLETRWRGSGRKLPEAVATAVTVGEGAIPNRDNARGLPRSGSSPHRSSGPFDVWDTECVCLAWSPLIGCLWGCTQGQVDLKEKKEVVEEAENGRDAPANGNAENEENGEQEADNEVDEEEEEGGEEEEEEEEGDGEEEDGDEDEEAEAATGKRAAEDDEDDDVDTKKQKTDEDD